MTPLELAERAVRTENLMRGARTVMEQASDDLVAARDRHTKAQEAFMAAQEAHIAALEELNNVR